MLSLECRLRLFQQLLQNQVLLSKTLTSFNWRGTWIAMSYEDAGGQQDEIKHFPPGHFACHQQPQIIVSTHITKLKLTHYNYIIDTLSQVTSFRYHRQDKAPKRAHLRQFIHYTHLPSRPWTETLLYKLPAAFRTKRSTTEKDEKARTAGDGIVSIQLLRQRMRRELKII